MAKEGKGSLATLQGIETRREIIVDVAIDAFPDIISLLPN